MDLCNDLWVFSFASGKWRELSAKDNTKRKNHEMWGARGKVWMYGGICFPLGADTTDEHCMTSTRDFTSFDLETKTWEKLAESCSIPLFFGAAGSEAKAILVW